MRSRLPQTLIVLVLLGATAAAFAVTERLKLEKSPITGTRVDKVFSPVCECARSSADISFRLRGSRIVTVDLLDTGGQSVRTLVRNRREQAGRVTYVWDGRDDDGRVVQEGIYRPRVRIRRHGRTIVLPNPIRVDTTAPTIALTRVSPRVFSPDGDGRRDRVTAEYEIDEPARAMMLVNGRRRVLSKFRETHGRLVWFGRVGGRPVRPGEYEIRLRAFDRAGNRSARTRAVTVRVRYVELVRDRVEAVAGRRFGIGVSTDAPVYRWLFDGKRGKYRKELLTLRAPEEPGTYVLYVTLDRWADRAEVVVSAPEQP
jgi:hypothetical protein